MYRLKRFHTCAVELEQKVDDEVIIHDPSYIFVHDILQLL